MAAVPVGKKDREREKQRGVEIDWKSENEGRRREKVEREEKTLEEKRGKERNSH